MASGAGAINSLTPRDKIGYANLRDRLESAAGQENNDTEVKELTKKLSVYLGDLSHQQKPVQDLVSHQDRLLIGKLENRDGMADFFRAPEMAPLRHFAGHGGSRSDRMDTQTDPNRNMEDMRERLHSNFETSGAQENRAEHTDPMRAGMDSAIQNSDVKQVERLLKPFVQMERDLGRNDVADKFESTLRTHQDNPDQLKQAIGETQLYKDMMGVLSMRSGLEPDFRNGGFKGALEDAAKAEGKKYTEKRDELRAGLMNHWAQVAIKETMSADTGSLKGPGLFGALTAGSLLQSTKGRIPDDVKKRLEDLQKQNPQLAGTIRETLWDKNRFEMSFDQNIREMQSLVHSGLPIESIVIMFSMLYMDTNEKRLQAKMSEAAALEAVGKENENRKEVRSSTLQGDQQIRDMIGERGHADASKQAADVEVPNITPQVRDPLKGRNGAQDKNPNHVRSWRRTLEAKRDDGKLLDGLVVAVNNSLGRVGHGLDTVPPEQDPNYKDVLVFLAGPDATTKLSPDATAAVDLIAEQEGVTPDQAREMIRDRLRESMDRGHPKLEAAARQAVLHDTAYLDDPKFTAYTPEQISTIKAHEAERSQLFTNLKNDPTAIREPSENGTSQDRIATLLRSHADVAGGKQPEIKDPEELEKEVSVLRNMGPQGHALADKIIASNEAKREYQDYTKEAVERIDAMVQDPNVPRGAIYKELAEASATKAALELDAKSIEHGAVTELKGMQGQKPLDPTKFGLTGRDPAVVAQELAALQKRFEQIFNALMNIMTTIQSMGDAIVRKIA